MATVEERSKASASRTAQLQQAILRGEMPRPYLSRALEAVQGALAQASHSNLADGVSCDEALGALREIAGRIENAMTLFDEHFD